MVEPASVHATRALTRDQDDIEWPIPAIFMLLIDGARTARSPKNENRVMYMR
jgi:hypothetical protein